MNNALVKSKKSYHPVIPAKAGNQGLLRVAEELDPAFHRGDDFLRARHG
ncbi:MAG: hypothetical protein KKD53_03940 [Proteobacteria bacterium]|nr:hypothetical protein [Pseudomonadota bacterium]